MQLEIPYADGEVYEVRPPSGVMVPMPWILRHVTSSSDFGSLDSPERWLGMMADKSDDSLAALIPSFETDGQLDPTVLFDTLDDTYSVGNGHHRLVLNILRGEDWHRVYIEDPHSWSDEGWFVSTEHEGREFDYSPDYQLAGMLRRSLIDGGADYHGCDCEDCVAEAA